MNQINQLNIGVNNQNYNIYSKNPYNRKEREIEINGKDSQRDDNLDREILINNTPKINFNDVNMNQSPNKNQNYIYQNLLNNLNIPNNNQNNLKELDELMETHKMLIELEKVQNDELGEGDYPDNNDVGEEYLEEVRKMNEEFFIDDENNIIIQNNLSKNKGIQKN